MNYLQTFSRTFDRIFEIWDIQNGLLYCRYRGELSNKPWISKYLLIQAGTSRQKFGCGVLRTYKSRRIKPSFNLDYFGKTYFQDIPWHEACGRKTAPQSFSRKRINGGGDCLDCTSNRPWRQLRHELCWLKTNEGWQVLPPNSWHKWLFLADSAQKSSCFIRVFGFRNLTSKGFAARHWFQASSGLQSRTCVQCG